MSASVGARQTIFSGLDSPHGIFGDLAMLVFVIVQGLDGALTYLGEIRRVEGDHAGALSLYEELVPLARDRGAASVALTLNNLAMIHAALGDAAAAVRAGAEAAENARQGRSKRARTSSVDVTAAVAGACGAWPECARLYGAVDAALERMGAQREPADAVVHEPMRRRAQEALGAERFAERYRDGRALEVEAALDEALAWYRAAAPRD